MSEIKWTLGPWQAHSLMVTEAGKPIGRGHDICHCGLGMRPNQDIYQSAANAQLIAAAPELYEAVVKLRKELELIVEWNSQEKKALRTQEIISIQKVYESSGVALAKARGEQP